MDFVAIKDYKGKNLLVQEIFIPYGTEIEMEKDFLYFQGIPFCANSSEVARKNFVWNGDGRWQARRAFEETIYLAPRRREWEMEVPVYDDNGNVIGKEKQYFSGRFTPAEIKYIKENFSEFLEPGDGLVFNEYFFVGSDIRRVQELADYLER